MQSRKVNHQYVGQSSVLPAHSNSQNGFTMVEILVAFIISLVGLQGLVAVQSLSLGGAQNSYYRAQAVTLLNDVAGRMNANPVGVSEGGYDSFTSKQAPSLPECYGTDSGCSANDIASRDLNNWSKNFTNVNGDDDYFAFLPSGIGTIDLQVDGSYLITVSWDESQWNTALGNGGQRDVVRASISRNINVLIPF